MAVRSRINYYKDFTLHQDDASRLKAFAKGVVRLRRKIISRRGT